MTVPVVRVERVARRRRERARRDGVPARANLPQSPRRLVQPTKRVQVANVVTGQVQHPEVWRERAGALGGWISQRAHPRGLVREVQTFQRRERGRARARDARGIDRRGTSIVCRLFVAFDEDSVDAVAREVERHEPGKPREVRQRGGVEGVVR